MQISNDITTKLEKCAQIKKGRLRKCGSESADIVLGSGQKSFALYILRNEDFVEVVRQWKTFLEPALFKKQGPELWKHL